MNKYNFSVKGTGSNVLIVHGWGGSLASLKKLQLLLSKKYRVYLLELPGHGVNPHLDRAWYMEDFRRFILNFINSINITQLIYIGHSFGGKIGIDISINNDIISKLILIDSSGIKPKFSMKKLLWRLLSKLARPITRFKVMTNIKTFFYKYVIRERDYNNTSGNLRNTFKQIISEHYDRQINNIKIPTLILWGEKDNITPIYMAYKLKKLIRDSKLVILPGRHSLPRTYPKQVSAYILKWLS